MFNYSFIHSKSWCRWCPDCTDNLELSEEGLSENAKTISLSPWKLTILQCVTNKGQEVLKSLAENPKISDLHVLGFRSVDILLSNGAFLDFLLIDALCCEILSSRFTHFFRRFFETGKQNPQTFSLLECMSYIGFKYQNRQIDMFIWSLENKSIAIAFSIQRISQEWVRGPVVMQESAKSWSTRWRERILANGGQKFKSEMDSFLCPWSLNILRCVTKCTCGIPKGKSFTVSETPVVNIPIPEKDSTVSGTKESSKGECLLIGSSRKVREREL